MAIDPRRGMTPNDWVEMEARRRERRERVHNPHGRELGARSRAVAAAVLGIAAVGLVVYVVLGWAGVIGA
jgi:hypothetical protein